VPAASAAPTTAVSRCPQTRSPALGGKLETCCVIIQGFANFGGMAAKFMSAKGFKIVSIVEYDGAT
jgi:glutamate dehydrogenase/leucine dehydrogenase